ncbi:nitroreductase family deazaflavin-dependent oxidoreductase [Actinophytocola sediminis]
MARRLVRLDRLLQRVSRGRWSATALLGMPPLLLTTLGRRSGVSRTSPLTYVRHGAEYVVIGSNWGGREHPGWSANLLADQHATVTIAGRAFPVLARVVAEHERADVWRKLVELWPAYVDYAERAGRPLRIFLLAPIDAEAPDAGG